MLDALADENAIARLKASGQYRVLRRIDLDHRADFANDNSGNKVGLVVDVETTSSDARVASIIELSLRRFRFDDDGRITQLGRVYTWLEDPGCPLDPIIERLTKLTPAALAGERIDDDLATSLLRSAAVVIAFNASFDRHLIERRLPQAAGLAWACAMREVDWFRRGFDGSGRSLGYILAQAGYFNDRSHCAAGDVDATIAILEHQSPGGETALFELLETASQRTWRIAAVGAHYMVKEALRAHGYRWDPDDQVWWREVGDDQRQAEEAWLAEAVYAPAYQPRMDRPHVREVTWFDRHG